MSPKEILMAQELARKMQQGKPIEVLDAWLKTATPRK